MSKVCGLLNGAFRIAWGFIYDRFGFKITLLGITGYYIGTAGFLGAVIAKSVIKENNDFLIVYWIGCGFAIMGWVICLFTKEDKFIYIQVEEEMENSETEQNLMKQSNGTFEEN